MLTISYPRCHFSCIAIYCQDIMLSEKLFSYFSYYESCLLCRATFLYCLFIFAWPWQSHFHTSSKSKWREIKIHHVSVTALAVSVFCFVCLLRKMVHFCKYLNSYSRCSFDFTAGFLVTCAEGTAGRPCMSARRSFSPTCSQLLQVWFRFNLKWFLNKSSDSVAKRFKNITLFFFLPVV